MEKNIIRNRFCSKLCLGLGVLSVAISVMHAIYILFLCGIIYIWFAIYFERTANTIKRNNKPISKQTLQYLKEAEDIKKECGESCERNNIYN